MAAMSPQPQVDRHLPPIQQLASPSDVPCAITPSTVTTQAQVGAPVLPAQPATGVPSRPRERRHA